MRPLRVVTVGGGQVTSCLSRLYNGCSSIQEGGFWEGTAYRAGWVNVPDCPFLVEAWFVTSPRCCGASPSGRRPIALCGMESFVTCSRRCVLHGPGQAFSGRMNPMVSMALQGLLVGGISWLRRTVLRWTVGNAGCSLPCLMLFSLMKRHARQLNIRASSYGGAFS